MLRLLLGCKGYIIMNNNYKPYTIQGTKGKSVVKHDKTLSLIQAIDIVQSFLKMGYAVTLVDPLGNTLFKDAI